MSFASSPYHAEGLHHYALNGMRAPSLATVGKSLGLGVGSVLAYLVGLCLYNLLLHPLRRFPGPKLWAMTRVPHTLCHRSGLYLKKMEELHAQYGPVVRVAPEIVSLCHPDMYKDTRGHRTEMGKDPIPNAGFADNILGANKQEHARFRRILSHGFSAAAMVEQQPLIRGYVDRLLKRLRAECTDGPRVLNMAKWYNYTTFDVIGDLSFGESFGCLENSAYHPWVDMTWQSVKNFAFAGQLGRYKLLAPLLMRFAMPKEIASKFAYHKELSREKVKKRLAMETERPDFVQKMLEGSSKGNDGLNFDELTGHASTLILAGSETTATTLSTTTFLLTTHPGTLARLCDEVRNAFTSEDEMDLISTQKLRYLQAVLDETMRLIPTAGGAAPRLTPKGQPTHAVGEVFPPDTVLEMGQWALFRNPKYFTAADEFHPERWLGTDPRFANDRLDIVLPFSIGPRACIGRNLAVSEMRLILTRVIWNFDMTLDDSSRSFIEDARLYTLWVRPPLNIRMKLRVPEVKV